MIAELQPFADAYKANGDLEALAMIYEYFENNTLFFIRYYNNPDGMGPEVTAEFNMNGIFKEFAKSSNFPTPDLLEIIRDNSDKVYVLFSALLDQKD